MLFVGGDRAEARDDIEIQDAEGRVLIRWRRPAGVVGVGQLHALVARIISRR